MSAKASRRSVPKDGNSLQPGELLTIKITVSKIPAKIRDENFCDLEVNIFWNQEVTDLIEFGLLKDESIKDRKNLSFNGSKFFYG